VVRYVVGKTGAKMMSLQLAEGMRLMLRGSRGFTRRFDEFFSVVTTGHCACGVAFENGREIVVPAIDASPIFARQKALDVLRAEGVASCVSTPLLGSNGRIAGMLSLDRDRVWSPLEGELAQLRHMASNIAAALADPLGAEARRLRAGVWAACITRA
jgi:GAF domain-containing protein